MQANQADRPSCWQRRSRHSPWPLRALLLLMMLAVSVALLMFVRPIVIDLEQLKRAVYFVDSMPVPSSAVEQVNAAPTSNESKPLANAPHQKVLQPRIAPAIAQTAPSSEDVKQRDFNDSNYVPRTDINTLKSVPVTVSRASSTNRARQEVRQVQSGYAYWQDARRRMQRYKIEWVASNGWIQFETVCQNYPKGTIEYRDCRKAAKPYFRERCRSQSSAMFCSAENRYFP